MLYNDDCFNVFPSLQEKSIDLVLVDLPYGQTKFEWDCELDLTKMWDELKRICRDKCNYVFFTNTKYGVKLIQSNYDWFRYEWIWEKNTSVGFLTAKMLPLRNHEMIYVFSNPKIQYKGENKKTYNPQMTQGEPYKVVGIKTKNLYGKETTPPHENKSGDRYPKSVLKFDNPSKKLHPTEKPVALCEWLIKTYSNEGDLVMDFCMGSGSTIVSCLNINRNFIGIEKNKEIFSVAENRINKNKG